MRIFTTLWLTSLSTVCFQAFTSNAFNAGMMPRAFQSYATTISDPATSSTSLYAGKGFAKVDDATKFQTLLNELQAEGVPLLGCDANQVNTFSAALWTTLSEMSEEDKGQKACLVLEKIPVGALTAFTEDFSILKMQDRLMHYLPELRRVSVSLVGKGVGPALVLETTERTPEEIEEVASRKALAEGRTNEEPCVQSLRNFVQRMVIGLEACPYTKEVDLSATGLEAKGVTPGPVAYRFSDSTDLCGALASFWTCICELSSYPEEKLSTTVLSLPGIGAGVDKAAHNRFAAVVEVISRNLCLYRGDDVFGLVHFHPAYDRSVIYPDDKAAYGHLPPREWLRPMLNHLNFKTQATEMTDEELSMSDYQRRSPFTAINILRASQLDAASGAKSIVDLDLGEERTEKASGLSTYCRNAMKLAGVGEESLQKQLDEEIQLSMS